MEESSSSAVLADAQRLVLSLTAEVRKLKEEKKILRANVDSITKENLVLSKDLRLAKDVQQCESQHFEEQIAGLNMLQTKLGDRCDKFQLLLKLASIKTAGAEQERDQLLHNLQEEMDKVEKLEQQLRSVELESDTTVAYKQALQKETERGQKQTSYITALETALNAQYTARVGEAQQRHKAELELHILREELQVVKALGLGLGVTPQTQTTHVYKGYKGNSGGGSGGYTGRM